MKIEDRAFNIIMSTSFVWYNINHFNGNDKSLFYENKIRYLKNNKDNISH